MATKLYLTGAAAPYSPATFRGAWNQTTSVLSKALSPHKSVTDALCDSFNGVAETSAAANFDVCVTRFVSGPLAAQTISGTVEAIFGCSESNSLADFATHCHIYVTQGDSDTPRGTLLTDYVETTANEWTFNPIFKTIPAATAISSLAVSDGDRIVIELGYISYNTSTTSRTGNVVWGTSWMGEVAPDGVAGNNPTTAAGAGAGFFTFSTDIAWSADTIVRATHALIEAQEDADQTPAEGWLTHALVEVLFDNLSFSDAVLNAAGFATVAFVGDSVIEIPEIPGPLDGYIIIEMCFGVAPSGKLGYRNWLREHPSIICHWYLSDVGLPGEYNAEDEIFPNDAGLLFGDPEKGRGLLPEFGLSTKFNGTSQYVEVDYDFIGPGANDPFTFTALVRPRAVTSASPRCIHHSGASGGYLGLDTTGRFTFGANGGTKTTISQPVEAEGEYLAVGVYDGTNAYLHVWDLIAFQDGVYPRKRGAKLGQSGPTAVSIGPHGGSDAFIGKGGSEEFAGDIQGVACIGAALSAGELLELAECCIWTEITPDTRATVPISASRGLFSDRPDTRVSPTGSITFGMNNAENNTGSTQSWYSPNHANCRSGFDRGTPVRAAFGNEILGSTIQFIGALSEIQITPGIYADRITYCTAYDWIEEAARFNMQGIEAREDLRADEVLKLILGKMPNKPHEILLQEGSDTYPIVLDNTYDENAFAQSEFSRLALSELGLIYVTGRGIFTFETRTNRGALTVSAHSFDNDMSMSTPDASKDRVINQARITVHPKEVDVAATTVLYETTDKRIAFDHGVETRTFLQFRDPNQRSARFGGLEVVNPPTYDLNDTEAGGGVDVTGNPNITVTFEVSGSGIYVIVDNQYGQRVYLNIQVIGKGVYDFEPVTVIEKNPESIKSIGVSEVHIDMPYQGLVPIAQGAALQILNVFQEHVTRLTSMGFPARKDVKYINAAMLAEISSRVFAAEEMSGVASDFFINGIKVEWRQDQEVIVTWFLAPADMQEYWIMDVSALDISTRLGFA